MVEKSKDLVEAEEGKYITVKMHEEEFEEVDCRSVLFRCVNRANNRVMYPTLEEVRPVFQECWNQVEFKSKGEPFGTVKGIFKTEVSKRICNAYN